MAADSVGRIFLGQLQTRVLNKTTCVSNVIRQHFTRRRRPRRSGTTLLSAILGYPRSADVVPLLSHREIDSQDGSAQVSQQHVVSCVLQGRRTWHGPCANRH